MVAYTKIKIISDALIILGKGPINSLEESGEFGRAAGQIYDRLYPASLIDGNWRFAATIKELSRDVDSPGISEWKYSFQIPHDSLKLIRTIPDCIYQIYGDKIWTNYYKLTAEYFYQVPEEKLPLHFIQFFVYRLAEELIISIGQQKDLATYLSQKALQEFSKAQAADAYQRDNISITYNRYINVRSGSSYIRN